MNQPIITRNPIAVVDAAHEALQAAIKEHRDRLAAEKAIDITTPIGDADHARARVKNAAEGLSFQDRMFLSTLAEHGARSIVDLDTTSADSFQAWHRQNDLRYALEDIVDRTEATTKGTAAHLAAVRAKIGQLPEGDGAAVLRTFRSWLDSRKTAKQVQTLRNLQRPPINRFIDTDAADEERAEAWTVYRAHSAAPQSLEAYAWPGGSTIYYTIETETGTIDACPRCAADEEPIAGFQQNGHQEGPPIYCEVCNVAIESDYGDPDAEEDADAERTADQTAESAEKY